MEDACLVFDKLYYIYIYNIGQYVGVMVCDNWESQISRQHIPELLYHWYNAWVIQCTLLDADDDFLKTLWQVLNCDHLSNNLICEPKYQWWFHITFFAYCTMINGVLRKQMLSNL